MRNRRVGTVSMGVLLISVGILLLCAQLKGAASFQLLTKWWPLILMLLGGEILVYVHLAKEENPKIKYDVFSIFIVLLLTFAGLGLYGLNQSGILPRVNMMLASQSFVLGTPVEEIKLDASINKIVINPFSQGRLIVRSGSGDVLSASGTAYITADTQENAEKMLAEKRINLHQNGDTLFVSFNLPGSGSDFGYQARIREYMLIVPDDLQVEIDGSSQLEVVLDNINNNWVINNRGQVELRVSRMADAEIEAFVPRPENLQGNGEWAISKSENTASDKNPPELTADSLLFGEGKHRISIFCNSDVTVNKI